MTKRLCRCGAIVDGRCERCAPVSTHNKTTAERGYDHAWQQIRARKAIADPLCERCLTAEVVKPMREVHHVVPININPSLRLVWSNLQSLCRECHQEIEPKSYGRGVRVQAGV